MTEKEGEPELTYIHTGFYAVLLLNLNRADFVIGGCETGQGFLNSIMQYPNVICGLANSPLDAWLFSQTNAGNAISLALNQGFGSEVNLRFIFDRIFREEMGGGYPTERAQSQSESRKILGQVSKVSHVSFAEIIRKIDEHIIGPVLEFPAAKELIDVDPPQDIEVRKCLKFRMRALSQPFHQSCHDN